MTNLTTVSDTALQSSTNNSEITVNTYTGEAYVSQRKAAELLGVARTSLQYYLTNTLSRPENYDTSQGLSSEMFAFAVQYYALGARSPTDEAKSLLKQITQAGTKAYLYYLAGHTIMNQTQTMSSREIANLTGKQHKHVLEDARNMLNTLGINSAEFSAQYRDSSGKENLLFNLPKRECLILVSGYSVQLRAKIIDRWQELEQVTQTLADSAGVPKEVLIKDAKDDALLAKLQASTEASKAKIELSRLKVQTAKERDALKLKAAKEKYAEQSKVLHARTTKLLSQGALVKGDMTAGKLDMPTDTITNLLKEHGSTVEPKLANWALRQLGYLTKTHEVTDTGHYYGRNIKSSPRSKTTLARWFPSEFPELLKQIDSTIEDLVNN